jgi:hypothetical protein
LLVDEATKARIGPRRLRRLLGLPPWRRPRLADLARGTQAHHAPLRVACLDALRLRAGSDLDPLGRVLWLVEDLAALELEGSL